MTFYLLDLYVIAAVCVLLAILCGGAWLVCWITSARDERHTRRIDDEANGPDDWTATEGLCEPGHCDVCDTWRAKMDGERER